MQVENKNAALSKAFLAYQVEQLERSLPASNKHGRHQSHPPRHEIDQKHNQPTKRIKDADVVVASAGVLLHAPSRVQRWCHPQSKEIVCIPLSALNTLDALKNVSGPLAARARRASRLLESQVGMNPRMRVQRDADFLDVKLAQDQQDLVPRWVTSTLSCAAWEIQAATTIPESGESKEDRKPSKQALKVALAVLAIKDIPDSDDEDPKCLAHFATLAGIEMIRVPGEPDHDQDMAHTQTNRNRGARGSNRVRRERGRGAPRGGAKSHVIAAEPVVATPAPTFRLLPRGEKLSPDPA